MTRVNFHKVAVGAAGQAGNANSIPRSPSILADLTVREFWSVRAAQPYISGYPDTLRTRCSGRVWNDPRIGARVWRTDPYLATADAPGRQDVGSGSNR